MLPVEDVVRTRRPFPFVTVAIIVLNVLVFAYELSLGSAELDRFVRTWGLVPYDLTQPGGAMTAQPALTLATLVTSMFIHGSFLHIFGNMLFLWVFGDNVEGALGHGTYLLFYLLSGLAAGLSQVAVTPQSQVPGIGASGAIAGVLAAYLLLFPHAQVRTLLLLGPFVALGWVAAMVLIGFWFVLQLVQGLISLGLVAESTGGIAFFAHVGGFLTGLALTLAIRRERHQPLADLHPLHGFLWNPTFRNWVIVAVWLLIVTGVAELLSSASPAAGGAIRSAALVGAAALAIFDAIRRALGLPSFLGSGRGWARLLALVQLGLGLALLLAVLSL